MKNINFMDSKNGSNTRIVEVQKVLAQIKKGSWKKQIEEIQHHISNGNINKADSIKLKLPAFTISATYKDKRKKENVESYSGLLHLDYDKLDNIQDVKSKIISNPYTYAAFVSPSGKGLKVLVKCDNDLNPFHSLSLRLNLASNSFWNNRLCSISICFVFS
jgi:hypothetical protein